jgi:type I restriction enzyme, R subunit
MTTAENQIKQELIDKLVDLKYAYRPDIRDEATLEQIFHDKFEALNVLSSRQQEFRIRTYP